MGKGNGNFGGTPDWVALRTSLGTFHANRSDPAARDAAFRHVYHALTHLARHIVAKRLPRLMGSVTEVSEEIVQFKKGFTEFACSYDPEKASFKTWAEVVLTNAFNSWCRKRSSQPLETSLNAEEQELLEGEWKEAVRDIADCDFDGLRRPGVVTDLVEMQDEAGREEHLRQMRAVIAGMPLKARNAIMTSEKKETQKQAAERLGISLAAYKRHRDLGMEMLRKAML